MKLNENEKVILTYGNKIIEEDIKLLKELALLKNENERRI